MKFHLLLNGQYFDNVAKHGMPSGNTLVILFSSVFFATLLIIEKTLNILIYLFLIFLCRKKIYINKTVNYFIEDIED